MYRIACPLMLAFLLVSSACRFRGSGADDSSPLVLPETQTVFRDDFDDGTLAEGWSLLDEDEEHYSLTEKPGVLRIYTQEGALGAEQTVRNLLVRTFSGDFVLLTRVEFTPAMDRQLAGLVIRKEGGSSVAFGITRVSGERGTAQGVARLDYTESDSGVARGFRVYDSSDVHLVLIRTGNVIQAGLSRDGTSYIAVGAAVSVELTDPVQIGIAAANGTQCGDNCDLATPADFDFFECRVPGSD